MVLTLKEGLMILPGAIGVGISAKVGYDLFRSIAQEKVDDLKTRIHGSNLETYLTSIGKTEEDYDLIYLETSQFSRYEDGAVNKCIIDICEQMDSRGIENLIDMTAGYPEQIRTGLIMPKKYRCTLSGTGLKPKSSA
jgi:hypothetical protein